MIITPELPIHRQKVIPECFIAKGSKNKRNLMGYIYVQNFISGSVKITTDKEERILSSGDTLIVNPYEEPVVEALEESRYYLFTIDQNKHFDNLCIPALTHFENFIEKDAFISDICRKMNAEYCDTKPFHENMLDALTSELLIHLYRSYTPERREMPSALLLGKHKIALLAVDYIYKNSVKGVSTREISEHINVSISYLCRCFKEATGVSILEYADRIRCRQAKEDLALGIYTVTQVAEKYNFNSLSYFNRRYKMYCMENPVDTLSKAKKRRS